MSEPVRPVSRSIHDTEPSAWWCPNCREECDGPWHMRDCPNKDYREVGG